jgi:hypothetical protein
MNEFNQLTITIDLEECTAGLEGQLFNDGFTGIGTGWFNITDVMDFADQLEQCALKLTGTAQLIGGESNPDGSESLETFALRCSVVSRLGILGVQVSLASYPHTNCRIEEISRVSSELKADVQSVLNFSQQLRNMSQGVINEATLVGR